jgi:hypothetical protein
MTTRKTTDSDAYMDAWNELTPRTSAQRAALAREDRLAELRQQAEIDALEPLNEYLAAYRQHTLDD